MISTRAKNSRFSLTGTQWKLNICTNYADLLRFNRFPFFPSSSVPILANSLIKGDVKLGVVFFSECRKFIRKTLGLMDVLREKIRLARYKIPDTWIERKKLFNENLIFFPRDQQMYELTLSNIWGIAILVLILFISPLLLLLARNVIRTFQVLFLGLMFTYLHSSHFNFYMPL